ncbi:GGDEF domain-containing protein [Vibrio sp. TBV020]|uniref:GGDEF domain-containing protein n=1 Tax=Vibrio sp. TBV020 TaxID=3137398 RepID=UPI0038CD8AA6
MNKLDWLGLISTRSLLGFVWSIGSIWFIQIDPERNLMATTFWCTALAYAGTIFHINSITSLQTYFWSLMAPLAAYFTFELQLYFEAFIIIISGTIYVTLYTKILHRKATTRIAEAIEKEHLIQQLSDANVAIKKLAEEDALTGLKNRMYFNQEIEKIWHKSITARQPLCLVLFDIDHFKAYNDNYGHIAGDEAIKMVAHSLDKVDISHCDGFFARVGGEEFVAVLPNVGLNQAIEIAEEIRFNVENSQLYHQYSSCSDMVTVSVGVSMTEPQSDSHINELIEQSDQALYRAKEGGRNIVATIRLHPHQAVSQELLT